MYGLRLITRRLHQTSSSSSSRVIVVSSAVAEQRLENGLAVGDGRWSEAIAVGSRSFVEKVKGELGSKAAHRDVIEAGETYGLKFAFLSEALKSQNTFLRDEAVDQGKT